MRFRWIIYSVYWHKKIINYSFCYLKGKSLENVNLCFGDIGSLGLSIEWLHGNFIAQKQCSHTDIQYICTIVYRDGDLETRKRERGKTFFQWKFFLGTL